MQDKKSVRSYIHSKIDWVDRTYFKDYYQSLTYFSKKGKEYLKALIHENDYFHMYLSFLRDYYASKLSECLARSLIYAEKIRDDNIWIKYTEKYRKMLGAIMEYYERLMKKVRDKKWRD